MSRSGSRWIGMLVLAVVLAVIAHVATVQAIPRVLMSATLHKIGHDGINRWLAAKPTTADSRKVIRPSPELAYSACVYDLRRGPVHMFVQPMAGYWSLSLFDAGTDNFDVWDNRSMPHGVDIWLEHGRTSTPPPAGVTVVQSPSSRGIALIRRRAIDPAEWSAVRTARSQDVCAAVH